MRFGPGVTEPVEVYRPHPPEIPESQRLWLARILIMEGVIQPTGTVSSIRVLRPDPVPEKARPCIDHFIRYFAGWRYRPARYRGQAVPVYITTVVHHVPC